MSDLRFAHPLFLWALAALPFLAALILHAEKMRRIALDKLISARLQPRLAGSASIARRRWGFAMVMLGLALAIGALARPQWGFNWEEKKQRGRDIIFAIDVSKSMLATDLQPNRLTRAKLAAEDLLNQLEGDRVGLLAFAGTAFLQAPLTSDFGAVRESLQELDTDIIPRGGTDLAAAIRVADEAFGKGESEHRALIFFSDGEELEEDAVVTARKLKDRLHIFTVGLGFPEGSLIPVPTKGGGTEFLKDDSGQYVKTKLDEPRMREVAEAGGGFYVALRDGPAEMQRIVRDGLGKMKERETDAQFTKVPIERYQWPLAAAIGCIAAALLLGERRRAAFVARVAATILLFFAPQAHAKHPGIEKFEQKEYDASLGEFDRDLKRRDIPELQFAAGTAAFELGDYERATAAFSKALGTANPQLKGKAAYNLANSLARRGIKQEKRDDKLSDLRDAVRQYDEVLNAEPGNADAKHNRDLVQKIIEELEKEEKQKQDQQKQDKQDDKKDDKDQQKQDSSQGGKGDDQKKDQDKNGKKEDQKQQDSSKGGKDDQGKQDSQQGQGEDQKKEQPDDKNPKTGAPDPKTQNEDAKPGDKDGQPPKPEPAEPDKQKSGEVKAANPGKEDPDQKEQAAEAAEAAAAAQEGRMTEKDAKQLFEALRKLDRRVRLLNPTDEKPKDSSRPFKNW